jgi:hypothetical protein
MLVDSDYRRELERAFREQQRFADGYSRLYGQLFGIVAGWLTGESADPVVEWLLEAAAGVRPFDVTLLLPAALHRAALAGDAPELARLYPTAGGRPLTAAGDQPPDVDFASALRSTVLARRASLAKFIQTRTVQTNETGRGLAWLLPVACLGWPAVHLVELGASAGLNLVAERRGYRLAEADDPSRTLLVLSDGPRQFTTLARGAVEFPPLVCCPAILSRTGGDLHPFHLHAAEDELTLASFVWADQVERMARLREGIAALRAVEQTAAPVRLRPLRLPNELPAFLARDLPRPLDAPVVIFNTTVSMYLPDRGTTMRRMIGQWAAEQSVPVLWLQWELPGDLEPPQTGWLAWTADYWPSDGAGHERHFLLAWVHPHGSMLEWGPDFKDLTGWRQ